MSVSWQGLSPHVGVMPDRWKAKPNHRGMIRGLCYNSLQDCSAFL